MSALKPGGGTLYAESVAFGWHHGGELLWAVIETSIGRLVGCTGLDPSLDRSRFELGYMFVPWAWSRGIATECSAALVHHAFTSLGCDEVFAHAAVENPASCRVLNRVGLRRVGNARCFAPARNHWVRAECYRLTWQEWRS